MTNRHAGATTPEDRTSAAGIYEGDNVREGVDCVQTGPAPARPRSINRRRSASSRAAVHGCAIMLP
jgi:hypothetical protein